MVKRRLNKLAFTMIELIFSIVIIAISVMSLPMLTQVTSSGIKRNLSQEAIFASAAEISFATTYVWDENSLIDDDDVNATGDDLSRVLNLDASCSTSGVMLKKIGHINRRCLDNNLTVRYADTDYLDSLEAAEHNYTMIYTDNTGASGYKQEYDSLLNVESCDSGNCIDFGLENKNINLKEITVSIREKDDTTNQIVTLLRTYSANIGEVAYENEVLLP